MDTTFSSTHLETLVDLQKLAKRHNCRISFGCRSDTNKEEINNNILRENGASEEQIAKITHQYEDRGGE